MCHIWPKSGLTCTWERQCRGGQGRCSALSSSGLPLMFLHPTCMRDGLQAHCVIVTGSLFSTVPTLPGMSASRSRHHREGAFPMASAGTWESHTDSGSPKHPLPRSACYFWQAPSRSRELIFVQGAGPAAPGPSRGGVPGNGARGADRPRPPCPHGAPLRVPSAAGAPARAYGRGAEGSERRGGARCGGGRWQSWLRFRGSASASGVPPPGPASASGAPLPFPGPRFRGSASGGAVRRGSHAASGVTHSSVLRTSARCRDVPPSSGCVSRRGRRGVLCAVGWMWMFARFCAEDRDLQTSSSARENGRGSPFSFDCARHLVSADLRSRLAPWSPQLCENSQNQTPSRRPDTWSSRVALGKHASRGPSLQRSQ